MHFHVQSSLDYPDLDFTDFSIIQTSMNIVRRKDI